MQTDHRLLYKMAEERFGEKEQQYKDIGNYIFASLYSNLRRPPCLILKLKGVGSWHLRKKRMKAVVELFPPDFEKKKEDFPTDLGFLKHENKVEIHHIFTERLKEYDEYIKERDEVRKIRYGTQTILKKQEDSTETSLDNLE